jgi:thiol:disulfide interchange protein
VKSLFTAPLLFLCLLQPTMAVSEADLLPVEQAYSLSVQTNSASEIQLNWTIADGYYLYKQRFSVSTQDPSLVLGQLLLPAGDKHHDEFFGDVETYRQHVSGTLSIQNPQQLEQIVLHLSLIHI